MPLPDRSPDFVETKERALSLTINSDMGESLGIHSFGNDEGLLPLIDTANVACGFHAGDPAVIRHTVRSAAAAGITIGAHPGLPDLVGFGRREMQLLPDEVHDIVLYQVAALKGFLDAEDVPLDHIKPHGSLYGMLARDAQLMHALCDVAAQYGVPIYGMADTLHQSVADARGIPFIAEFYVDLGYRADGGLIITRRPPATPPALAAERARIALQEGVAVADTGERLPVRFSSICVHSDTPTAIDVATAVRQTLQEHHGH